MVQRYLTLRQVEFIDSRPPSPPAAETESLPLAKERETLSEATDRFEKAFLFKALEKHHGNRTHTARSLGIGLRTLQRKLLHHGISQSP
ncbi:MAG: hypothetical protein MI742_13675, partial [Desulfobacterales bacterium]|nr:hypothetical protein [Desulfobacterales bacterium]